MTALKQLLEEGSCQVRGQSGRQKVIRLELLLHCSGVSVRTTTTHSESRIKETWLVRQQDLPVISKEQVTEPVINLYQC